ncbi:MAG: hypothetical protein IK036_04065 [Clostridia bacterium]|nr:hypothetical protein [Clostridia bacterium]MBR5015296.1 hypothetical protein [Clostridia bacterium]MBR5991913.1 hypothetical protein [Clostridia bacterium]MBR6479566.1 hypothetical protein [Clostridia bacterium]MBR6512925.1 hypothetical protein [Clostridia bacterium]
MAAKKEEFLTYKGKPLVRKGNTLYYGNMFDPYVIVLTIKSTTTDGDMEMADKVSIQLISTDPNISPAKAIVKTSEKTGLYNAMDIGSIWLERALKDA